MSRGGLILKLAIVKDALPPNYKNQEQEIMEGAMRLSLPRLGWMIFTALMIVFVALTQAKAGQEPPTLRVGVLKFGTVSWEMQIIETHRLAEKRGLDLEIVPLASENALAVALQGGRVDLIVSDWLWVAHQRGANRRYQFAPYSLAVGAVMVDPAANIDNIGDLAGRKLGIAGGPVDKTWLLLRAYAQVTKGIDLEASSEPTYAAPPMINRLMLKGDLPAAINFWHYNARLEAMGMQPLLSVEQLLNGLDIQTVPPLLGWVFGEEWAAMHQQALSRFLDVSYDAKEILAESDEAWEGLRTSVKPESDSVFAAIKAGYRAGIPRRYGMAELEAAEKLFRVLAKEGGAGLSGNMQRLERDIFWDGFRLP